MNNPNILTVPTVDIIYLNEAVKALKQKKVAVYGNCIIGLDNIAQYVCYTMLDLNMIGHWILTVNAVVTAADLNSFVSAIQTESSFLYDIDNPYGNLWTATKDGKDYQVAFVHDKNVIDFAITRVNNCHYQFGNQDNFMKNIDDEIQKLRDMKRADGTFYLVHNGYFITMFPGLLPVLKTDKVFLTIYDMNATSFVAKFTVKKKKFEVYIYLAYLKVQ